jgi:LmbE family N-acetylglucosaminyl deacetylase
VGQRLLVLSPHPDDESIGCSGLLHLHKGKADIHLVNIFSGDRGGSLEEGEWRDEPGYKNSLVELRKQEFDRVAAKLGAASVTRFNLSNCIGVAGATRRRIVALAFGQSAATQCDEHIVR